MMDTETNKSKWERTVINLLPRRKYKCHNVSKLLSYFSHTFQQILLQFHATKTKLARISAH